MYHVRRFDSAYSEVSLGAFETIEEALAFLAERKVEHIEEDPDHPGCFDGVGPDGRIYSIDKFKKVL